MKQILQQPALIPEQINCRSQFVIISHEFIQQLAIILMAYQYTCK